MNGMYHLMVTFVIYHVIMIYHECYKPLLHNMLYQILYTTIIIYVWLHKRACDIAVIIACSITWARGGIQVQV